MTSFFVVPSFAPVSLEQLPAEPDDVTIICRQEARITDEVGAGRWVPSQGRQAPPPCCAGCFCFLCHAQCPRAAPYQVRGRLRAARSPAMPRRRCACTLQLQEVREYNRDAEPLGVIAAQVRAGASRAWGGARGRLAWHGKPRTHANHGSGGGRREACRCELILAAVKTVDAAAQEELESEPEEGLTSDEGQRSRTLACRVPTPCPARGRGGACSPHNRGCSSAHPQPRPESCCDAHEMP